MDQNLNPKSYRQPVEVTFTFPESMQLDVNYKSVTIRELKASAEARALARAGNDGARLIQELVRESIVAAVDLDGVEQKITTADESIEIFMDRVGPKGRTAIMAAYSSVNNPQPEDVSGFLRTANAKVK